MTHLCGVRITQPRLRINIMYERTVPDQHNSALLSPSSPSRHAVYQHTPALPPAPYHKPKYEPVVYEEEYPKQNCSVVDETIKVNY